MTALAVLGVAALAGAAVELNSDVTWRFKVVVAKLSGQIPEIPLISLVKWLRPGSPVYLGALADNPNVNASISNLHDNRKSAEAGARIYNRACEGCHGENGTGRNAPSLIAAIGGTSNWSFFSIVKWGLANTTMRAQPLSDIEIWQVHAFIKRSVPQYADLKNGSAPTPPPFQAVSFDRLVSAARSADWLTYGGNYAGHRHFPSDQVNRNNVYQLRLAWAAHIRSAEPLLESTPIVAGNRMFVTESSGGVVALDAKTGGVLWEFLRPVPASVMLCCGEQNRGVAILDDSVVVATLDAHLIALDASTGRERWDATVADWKDGYSITGAPLAIQDEIVVGIAGGEFGVRGFLSAYSAVNGALRWKFYTVPAPGEPGSETWAGDSAKHGGAAPWNSGSYDPNLNLVYWGTGNPSPLYDAEARKGANLYSNSMIALDASSGKLRWYFQYSPNDDHDWDAAEHPVLADIPWQGHMTAVLLQANRNGFFYVLDRRDGRFLTAQPYAKQTWADGVDSDGHPLVRSDAHPSRTGTLVWPGVGGATNWEPPSFDPGRRLFFVLTFNQPSLFFTTGVPRFRPNEMFTGSATQLATNQPVSLSVKAIDGATGQVRWKTEVASGGVKTDPHGGGVLSTEGGVVFAGCGTKLIALDADTGKWLWDVSLGARIHAPPTAYAVDGQEFVEAIAGRTMFSFALPWAPKAETFRTSVVEPQAGDR